MDTVWIIVALIAAGLVLFLLEILTPSFGILAALAIAAMVASVVYSFSLSNVLGMIMIVVLAIGVPAYLIMLVKFLPNSRLGDKLFLRRFAVGEGEGTPDAGELKELEGKTGIAETTLRPSGLARVEGRRVSAVAESGMIPKGTKIRVIRARGTDVVCKQVAADG